MYSKLNSSNSDKYHSIRNLSSIVIILAFSLLFISILVIGGLWLNYYALSSLDSKQVLCFVEACDVEILTLSYYNIINSFNNISCNNSDYIPMRHHYCYITNHQITLTVDKSNEELANYYKQIFWRMFLSLVLIISISFCLFSYSDRKIEETNENKEGENKENENEEKQEFEMV